MSRGSETSSEELLHITEDHQGTHEVTLKFDDGEVWQCSIHFLSCILTWLSGHQSLGTRLQATLSRKKRVRQTIHLLSMSDSDHIKGD